MREKVSAKRAAGKTHLVGWKLLIGVCVWAFLLLFGLMAASSAFAREDAGVNIQLSPLDRKQIQEQVTPSPVTKLLAPPEQADLYGVVVKVEEMQLAPGSELFSPSGQGGETVQRVTVQLDPETRLKGMKSRTVVVENILGDNPAFNIQLRPGVRVLVNAEKHPESSKWNYYIANRDRTPAMMVLGSILILAVLLIGGAEVAKHVLLSSVILVSVYTAFFPAVMKGFGAVPWTLAVCFMFTILGSLIHQRPEAALWGRFTREQCVAILGTLSGLLLLWAMLWIMHLMTPIDGFSSEGLAVMWHQSPHMDYLGLFLSSALIAFQGFLFYLCWMLAQERQTGTPLSFSGRFAVVMMRGRRLLGPLISSLGLLLVGLYMPLLLQLQGTSQAQFVNLESTATLIVMVFSGGLTLLLCVPITALIAGWLLSERSGK